MTTQRKTHGAQLEAIVARARRPVTNHRSRHGRLVFETTVRHVEAIPLSAELEDDIDLLAEKHANVKCDDLAPLLRRHSNPVYRLLRRLAYSLTGPRVLASWRT